MANKPEGDVTRTAVVLATKAVASATERLKLMITTGPDQVMMSKSQINNSVANGNTDLAAFVAQTAGVDNDLLDQMAARGQIRGRG